MADQRLSTAEVASTLATSTHPLAPTVVVGLGNEIAGDDGAGIAVADLLRKHLADRSDVEVVCLPWAGFVLLDVLRGRKRAALLDCLVTGEHPPGTIVHIDEKDLAGSVRLNSFHDINYPTVMALGRKMGWAMPETIAIWGIEAETYNTFCEELSSPVAAAVEKVAAEVIEYLTPPCAAADLPHRVPPEGGLSSWSET